VLPNTLAIVRLAPDAEVPSWARGEFVSVTRTSGELSIVCDDAAAPAESDRGWKCLKLEGPMPLDTTGVAAAFTRVLADARVSVFVISTFDTDYVLVHEGNAGASIDALSAAGYSVQ
jgi:hypothetical protein